ncbi:MAG TPA: hypothetical protein VJ352_15990, partial [Geodermatophilus sp.]|nr:hypothetical protein [Geodermatophilus sp.]
MTARQDGEVPVEPTLVGGEPVEGGPVEQWQDWLPEWLTAPVDLPAGFGTAGSATDDAAPAPAPGAGVPGDPVPRAAGSGEVVVGEDVVGEVVVGEVVVGDDAPDGPPHDEVRTDEVTTVGVSPEEVLPEEVLPEEVLPEEVLPEEVLPEDVHAAPGAPAAADSPVAGVTVPPRVVVGARVRPRRRVQTAVLVGLLAVGGVAGAAVVERSSW